MFPISFYRNGKLSDHHKGDLTRIVRSNPINEEGTELEQNGHAFLYDVELVLGGKLNGLPRSELQYTTASEEGMTGDSRQRRKRKPTLLQDESNNNKRTTQTNKKKKPPTNSKNTAKTSSSKTTTAKNATNKKRGSTKTAGNTTTSTGKKKSKNSVSTAASASETTKVTIVDTKNPGNGKGMFERHKKEFERCLLRLQKLDMYNFFSDDDVPPEYDECYLSCSTATADENTATTTENTALDASVALQKSTNSSTSSDTPISSSSENENDTKKETDSIAFPNHPPYNFIVLRKRLEHDRYVLDRLRLVENEENVDSNGKRIIAKDGKRQRSPSFSIQHPIGIHWELFRDDIIGMCNKAVERNSGNFDDGTPGTLSNTAEKIKTAMEQIYEKTGSRQSKEMELSNDAHRFTKVIEAVPNQEAALQGKSWRRKGESNFYNRM